MVMAIQNVSEKGVHTFFLYSIFCQLTTGDAFLHNIFFSSNIFATVYAVILHPWYDAFGLYQM